MYSMKAIFLVKYGKADKSFEIRDTQKPEPGKNEVLIKVETFGLNFADVMARRGLYREAPPLPCILGYEVVGTIEKTGEEAKKYKPGQRIAAFTRFGGYAEYVKTPERAVTTVPENINNASATALITQYCTAYYAAYNMANLKEGEHVLIHAAAGGVGIALTQLAKRKGCIVYGTVSSEEKVKFLEKNGVDYAINYCKNNFVEEIIRIRRKNKIDVIFDPIGGKSFKHSRKLLAHGGRIITFGASEQLTRKRGLIPSLKLLLNFGFIHPAGLLMNSTGIIGVNMLRIAVFKPEILQKVLQSVINLAANKEIKPYVRSIFKAGEISQAHEYFESRKSTGKIVINW
jgi:NADPH:quinone reductase-like Zn-dependent oxidoreductase